MRIIDENSMAGQKQSRKKLFDEFFEPKFDNVQGMCEMKAESYQTPPQLITLIQNVAIFQGLENKDPNTYIKAFLTLCNTFKLNGVPHDTVKRILFSFSLRGQAMSWHNVIGRSAINTFEKIRRKFITK